MRAHQLNNVGVIINTIIVESLSAFPNLVDAAIGGVIGDSIIDGVVIPQAGPSIEKQRAIIQAQIDDLEKTSMLNRGSREFELVSMQDLANRQAIILAPSMPGQTVEEIQAAILARSVYWVKLLALNKQITILRNAMVAL